MSAVTTLNRILRGGRKPTPAKAYIIPLDVHASDAILVGQLRSFQYFPETISDSRGTNYQPKVIPGLSHPLYQWTAGGTREISFSAMFTRDVSMAPADQRFATERGTVVGASGRVAAAGKFSDMQVSRLQAAGLGDRRNVDIPSAVAWLRSFTYPEYSTETRGGVRRVMSNRPFPPRRMILGLPGVAISWGVPELSSDEIYCIMTQCDVSYQAFFSDGTPRVAKVDLTFAEVIQANGSIRVQDAVDRRSIGQMGFPNLGGSRSGR